MRRKCVCKIYLVLLSQRGLKLSMVEKRHSLERVGNGVSSYKTPAFELALNWML